MGSNRGGLQFAHGRPARLAAPPTTLPARELRLTLRHRPQVAVGDRLEAGDPLFRSPRAGRGSVISPIPAAVKQIIAWQVEGRKRYDVVLAPLTTADSATHRTDLNRPPPAGRTLDAWLTALGQLGPWPEFGLPFDLLSQLAAARRRAPGIIICIGLDAFAPSPDRSTLLRSFPDEAVQGMKLLVELTGSPRARLVVDERLAVRRRLRRRGREMNVRVAAAPNVYPAADPTLIVERHSPGPAAARGLPHRRHPMSRRVMLTTPWTVIRLARWLARGRLDLVRPVMVGWSTPGEPLTARWVFPGQALATLAPSLAGGAIELRGRAVVGHPMTGRSFRAPVGSDGLMPPVVPGREQLVSLVTSPVAPRPEPCIRCGWCAEVCPTALRPIDLAEHIDRHGSAVGVEDALRWCIQCGLCSHVCPTHLPLAQTLNVGKR